MVDGIEIWKPIIGFNKYEVSSFGRVKNIETGRILKPKLFEGNTGHKELLVNLYKNGHGKTFRVHRLVAIAFNLQKEHESQNEVDHINRNSLDNRVENLRWVTNRQNKFNQEKHKNNKTGYKGVIKKRNKFVAQTSVNGIHKYLGTFDTPEEASLAYEAVAQHYHGSYYYRSTFITNNYNTPPLDEPDLEPED